MGRCMLVDTFPERKKSYSEASVEVFFFFWGMGGCDQASFWPRPTVPDAPKLFQWHAANGARPRYVRLLVY